MSDTKKYLRLLREDIPDISASENDLDKYRYIVVKYNPILTGTRRCRMLGFNLKDEMCDYLSDLNMYETPHQVIDNRKHKVILRNFYSTPMREIANILTEALS